MTTFLQFASPPSFHHLQLADSDPLSTALSIVANHCNRGENSTNPASNQSNAALLQRLNEQLSSKFSYDPTIRTLRCLSDAEWNAIDFLPAMARIYLKYLTRQSKRIPDEPFQSGATDRAASASPVPPVDPALAILMRDFNGGQPFDFSIYQSSLTTLTAMGFPQIDALEALLVTENKGPESALSYLFAESDVRARKREEAKVKYAKSHPFGGLLNATGSTPNPGASSSTAMYREFLRGALLNGQLSERSYEAIKSERERRKLPKSEHEAVLKELGVTSEEWSKMRKARAGANPSDTEVWDLDCVVCLDQRKSHVVLKCGHLCMCGDCATQLVKQKGKKAKCPMCEQEITDVLKVFL